MSLYFHTTTFERREIADDVMEAWLGASNPKADDWQLVPAEPEYDAETQAAAVWGQGEWLVRDLTADELAAKTRKVWPDRGAFWAEFTIQEKAAILGNSGNPTIGLVLEELRMWNGEVWSDDPNGGGRVMMGLTALVGAGIISEERKAEVLAK